MSSASAAPHGEFYSNIGDLRGLLVLSATAVNAAVALSTIDSDRSVGLEWTIRMPLQGDPDPSCIDEVSFKDKGHLPMVRDAASIANHLELVVNIKTLLSFYQIVDSNFF